MSKNAIREKVQKEAVDAVLNANGIGTVFAATGTGKMIIAFKFLFALYDSEKVKKNEKVFFLAETEVREKDLKREALVHKKLFGRNPYDFFDINFFCYQSLPQGERSIDIYDEIDYALTEVYGKTLLNSTAKYKIGLTGTNSSRDTVFKTKIDASLHGQIRQSDQSTKDKEVTRLINKGQLLDIVCPVVFEYPLAQGIKDGILSPYRTVVIDHVLGRGVKTHKIWSTNRFTKKPVYGSESDYFSQRMKFAKDWRKPKMVRGMVAKATCRFLYNLPSKALIVKKLLEKLEGKTLIFGVEKKILKEITPNVVENDNAKELIDKFDNGEISVIASAKKLERGITLKGVNNVILVSYYSTSTSLLQKLGRVLRLDPNKEIANVFIIRTKGTYEEDWFDKFVKIYNSKGKVSNEVDLKIHGYIYSPNLILPTFKLKI